MNGSLDCVILGGTILTPEGTKVADVGLADGRIAAIGDLCSASAAQTIRANGLRVMPGAIDTQVHFREPGFEHKEDLATGTLSAVAGGVTSVFEMPNTSPTTTTADALQDKLDRAQGRVWSNVAFFVGASPENIAELPRLEQLPGTPGIKIFMGSSTGSLLVDDDDTLRAVLRAGVRPCPVHAEDEPRNRECKALLSANPHPREHPFLRDALSAEIATRRLLALCAETKRPVHVLHISTANELPLLAQAKRQGLPVSCEVTPQHLLLDDSAYEAIGSLAQMNPPVRSAEHRQAIETAFKEGLFDVMGSDHAPHTLEEKAKPYPHSPSGMPGVQTLLLAALHMAHLGWIDRTDVPRLLARNPARLYGIAGKGELAVGFDADLTLVDLDGSTTVERTWVRSKSGWSPFEGQTFRAKIVHVLVGGSLSVIDGEPVGQPSGQIVRFNWKTSNAI